MLCLYLYHQDIINSAHQLGSYTETGTLPLVIKTPKDLIWRILFSRSSNQDFFGAERDSGIIALRILWIKIVSKITNSSYFFYHTNKVKSARHFSTPKWRLLPWLCDQDAEEIHLIFPRCSSFSTGHSFSGTSEGVIDWDYYLDTLMDRTLKDQLYRL